MYNEYEIESAKKIFATDLFNWPNHNISNLYLKKTKFAVRCYCDGGIIWRNIYAYPSHKMPFELVFRNVPKEIQEGLIYHLDIFLGG